MPKGVKKVKVRAPGNRSALSRVFAETIRDGRAQYEDDDLVDESESEEELDDDQIQYTVQELQARDERQKARTRAELVQNVIGEIAELNRAIQALGQPVVPTPVSDQYVDESMLDAGQYDEAMKRLPAERQALEKALAEARRKNEEDGQGAQRAKAVQARIDSLKKARRQIVEVWEGTAPDTPCADQYDGRPTLSQKEHADALSRLSGEESAVQQALDQAIKDADAKGEQWVKERDEGQARAKTAQRRIFEVSELYTRVSNLAASLGIEPAEGPDHKEVEQASLIEGEFNDLQNVLAQEKQHLNAWLGLLQRARSWAPEELIDRESEAETAYTSLQDALRADQLLTQAPPGGVKAWMDTLAEHRLAQRAALDLAALRDAVKAFYDLQIQKKPAPKLCKDLMVAFATEYGYKPEQWSSYKAIYQEYAKADKEGGAPPRDGRLTRLKLRNVLPSGNTAGQWYTADQSLQDNNKTYHYHLSVAFSVTLGKKGAPDMATITGAHVSFKRYNDNGVVLEDRKCWYSIKKGTFTGNGVSPNGPHGPTDTMQSRAGALLSTMAPRLNCSF